MPLTFQTGKGVTKMYDKKKCICECGHIQTFERDQQTFVLDLKPCERCGKDDEWKRYETY